MLAKFSTRVFIGKIVVKIVLKFVVIFIKQRERELRASNHFSVCKTKFTTVSIKATGKIIILERNRSVCKLKTALQSIVVSVSMDEITLCELCMCLHAPDWGSCVVCLLLHCTRKALLTFAQPNLDSWPNEIIECGGYKRKFVLAKRYFACVCDCRRAKNKTDSDKKNYWNAVPIRRQ